jgi:hypothetical protein
MAHRPRLHIPILNGSVRLKADIDRLISPRPLCAISDIARYSISSSACSRNASGIVRPMAFAVLTLTAS